ncbi:MAG: PAS domain S-box protein, partial [Bdellovibrionota bacterium]
MAAAIAGMHYIGMYSMRMDASIVWNVYLVILSVVVALVASFGALFISRRFRDNSDRFAQMSIAASLMGFAIAGMHYTGMIAATFVHSHGSAIAPDHLLVSSGLTIAVVSGTLVILGLALAGSVGQRLLSQRRRIAEETLSKSEARFKALIEAVKDYAIFMLDTEGNISTWNMGAERITGYPSDTVIGRHVSMFYTADELKNRPTSVELYAARTMGHFEAEAQRVRKNGSTFWANIVIAPLYDADKSLVGYSKVIRDVTELREAATRLRKMNEELEKRVESRTLEIQHRETQLRMIANALPVLVGQVDRDERVLFANDSLSEWYGRTPAQMTGSSLKEILGVNYEESRLYIEIALAGKSATYERLSHSGRRSAVLNITYVPEIGDNGEVLGFILVASDVSKYKEIEVEL